MGELMQSDLAKIGIKVKLVDLRLADAICRKRTKASTQMLQMGWTTDNGDPDNFMNILFELREPSRADPIWRAGATKHYDKIITKAKTVNDVKSRTVRKYFKAQELFKKEAPWVTIAHATVFRGVAKGSRSCYKISPLGVEDFYPLDIK